MTVQNKFYSAVKSGQVKFDQLTDNGKKEYFTTAYKNGDIKEQDLTDEGRKWAGLDKPKVIKPKILNVDTSRPSMVSGGRPMVNFDAKKLDKASGTAGAFTANLVDSATLGLATKGLNKFENGLGDKALADASKGHKVAATVGNLAGYTVPFGVTSKIAKPLTKGITNKLLKTVAVGATEGALVGGAEGGIKGKSVVKSAGEMAALGVGGNLAIAGLGKLVGKVLKPRVFETKVTPKTETQTLKKPTKLTNKVPKNQALEDYYSNLEYQDYINNLDPAYVKAENAARAKKGLSPIAETKTGVIVKKGRQVVKPSNVPSKLISPTNDTRDMVNTLNKAGMSVDDVISETKAKIKDIEDNHFEFLKSNRNGTKNYDRGSYKTENGYHRYSVTDNPEWYSEYVGLYNQKPTNNALRRMATDHLENGFKHYGDIPSNQEYLALKKELSQLENIKSGNPITFKKVAGQKQLKEFLPTKPTSTPIRQYDEVISNITPQTENITQRQFIPNNPLRNPKLKVPSKSVEQPNIITQATTPIGTKVNGTSAAELGNKQSTSKFYSNSLMEGNMLTKEGKKALDETQYIYNVKHNEDSLKRATDLLNSNGVENEVNRLMSNGLNSSEDSMTHYLVTKELMNQAKVSGDYSKLNSFLETTRPSITNAGQTIQALSQFKKTTPEGAVMTARKVVDNVTDALKKDNPNAFKKATNEINKLPKDANFEANKNEILKKNGIPTLTNDELKEIADRMTNAQVLEGRAKDIEVAKAMQIIGDKVPVNLAEKVKALQRISLLLNTKTMGRNVIGNTILGTLENAKDVIGTPLDILVSKATGKRSTMLPNLLTQSKGLKKGFTETLQDAKLGIDTSPTRGQYDVPQGKIFKNKLLNGLDKATKTGLQLGDRPFYEGAYNDRLNQLMKINKVSTPTEDMINQATEFAKDRTFQNDSNIAKGMKWIQEGLNKLTGNKDIGIGTFAVPFTKTPANILDKAISYSPVGYGKALNELRNVKPGTFNQKNFIDNIARGTTGTGLIMLGYDLASKGHLMGATNKDKDVAALQKQTGASPYSIKAGNDYYTIDWAQPSAIPLMIGADIFHGGKDRKGAENVVLDAVKSGGETLFKQSLLQGVQKLFGGNTPLEGITDVAKSIPSQFIPSSLKQVAQALDKNQREAYSTDTSGYVKNSITSKLPIVSKNMQPKVDTLGRDVETYQGKNTPFNILLNPGFKTTEKSTLGEKLALDIYNKSGLKNQFPRVAPKSIKGTPLTEQQFTDLQREMGKEALDMLDKLAKNVNIDNMTDKQIENLAAIIESRLTKISSISKKRILPRELLNKR